MPREERDLIEQTAEIAHFMWQRNISEKNITRLQRLEKSPIPAVQELAALVLEVARVKPHKRRRVRFLAEMYPMLLRRLAECDLIDPEEAFAPEEVIVLDDPFVPENAFSSDPDESVGEGTV